MLRALRIVATLLALAACVFVVMLKKRSEWLHDAVYAAASSKHAVAIGSDREAIRFYTFPAQRLSGLPAYGMAQTCYLCCSTRLRTAVLYDDGSRGFDVAMPHWLAALLAATAATVPWLRPRFSLRTLLIGTTLVSVVLGIIAANH